MRVRWVQRCLTSYSRVLPDFVIIGAQRAGTTSLYSHLTKHPAIIPSLVKEIHYFDVNPHRPRWWYRAHFPRRSQIEEGYDERRITGEATPRYLYHPGADERLHALLPGAKLIVLLRNPADRALSHYFFLKGKDAPLSGLREAVEREAEAISTKNAIAAETGESFLRRGLYLEQLERWYKLFPRKQIQVLPSERFLAEPRETLAQVQRFLGLREVLEDDYRRLHATSYPELDESLRTWLSDFYRPHNDRLFELLGERFDWI